jgi:hypothetical protein
MYKSVSQSLVAALTVIVFGIACFAQSPPLEIDAKVHGHFRFVVYGDTRFTDPADTQAANPEVQGPNRCRYSVEARNAFTISEVM